MATVYVQNFTDPACPWAFSAEPALLALRWRYGDALAWTPRMVGLSERPEDALARGFTPERLAEGMRSIQRRFGMPIATHPRERLAASVPACRAVVAARRHAPDRAEALLRALRVRTMAGAVLDDGATIAGAARDAGLDPGALDRWRAEPETEAELRADMDAARHPLPAALALDHKLAGWEGGRRYTCPSLVLRRADGGQPLVAPGFQPVETYEALLANLAPELERREAPGSVAELLAWAPWPLATREVAEVCGLEPDEAREDLARLAEAHPVGPDAFWALPQAAARAAA